MNCESFRGRFFMAIRNRSRATKVTFGSTNSAASRSKRQPSGPNTRQAERPVNGYWRSPSTGVLVRQLLTA